MEITSKTRLGDLLSAYPQLEEKIIQVAPAFRNLKNPILRQTVGKLATIEKVVQIGGLDLTTFVNLLRREVGQTELTPDPESPQQSTGTVYIEEPQWIKGEPQYTLDGSALLAAGEVPVNKLNELLPQLDAGRYILLITDFEPVPMIDAVKKQKRDYYQKRDSQNPSRYLTYIK